MCFENVSRISLAGYSKPIMFPSEKAKGANLRPNSYVPAKLALEARIRGRRRDDIGDDDAIVVES